MDNQKIDVCVYFGCDRPPAPGTINSGIGVCQEHSSREPTFILGWDRDTRLPSLERFLPDRKRQ